MKKKKLTSIYFTTVCLVVLGLLTFSCTKEDFDSVSKHKIVKERLRINPEELASILNDPTNYDNLEKLYGSYKSTYTPKSKLEKPIIHKLITKSEIIERREVSQNESINLLLNENNVFQYDHYIIFVHPEGGSIKQMFASDYDDFLASNPSNVFDIPQNIVLREAFIGLNNNGIPRIQTRSEGDQIDYFACSVCGISSIAAACGYYPGLFELATCIACYISLRNYYDCD